MKPLDQLTIAADNIRRAAPDHYDDLLLAISNCYDQSLENLVTAPATALQGQQGQAAAWRTALKVFREAPAQAAVLKGEK